MTGERILYVGSAELHLKADGTLWAQRYYTAGVSGTVIAVRTNATGSPETYYLAGDAHGTTTLAVKSDADQTFVKRSLTPFGKQRTQAAVGDWIDDKGFLGKAADDGTGLTHIGAREYDPETGTFLSVDPVLAADAPQTLNGYTYSANNPVTFSDPTGECPRDLCPGYGQNPHPRGQYDLRVYHGQGAGAERDRGLCFTCGSHSNFGDRYHASDLPTHASTSPSHLNTDSGKKAKAVSEHLAWYENWNNWNGANGLAITWSMFTDQECQGEKFQTVCYGSSPAGDQPITIGDFLFTGKSQKGWSEKLDRDKDERARIRMESGDGAAMAYGPHVYKHEAIHTRQWRESPHALVFIGEYVFWSSYSEWEFGDPHSGNYLEIQAGLGWGGYPLPK